MNDEFNDIRPYADGEVKQAVKDLLADRQFAHILHSLAPWLPTIVRNALIRWAFIGINTTLQFQLRYMKPLVRRILRQCSTGYTFRHDGIEPGPERYTFMSNHRDIVLDSAILSYLLHEDGFPTTCEIAIGDNLLIYPWIRILVKLNKAFTVQRGVSSRTLLESSQKMSRYMHHVINDKHDNIWIAQREGRAKDSDDRTQESIVKMMAMGGEGTVTERLQQLHIVPVAISYEYDPCDWLKAQEFQLKRDVEGWKKTKADDVLSMQTGIMGYKGHIHYHCAPCIDDFLASLPEDTPKADIFRIIAEHIDKGIHANYRLYANNYIAIDMLEGGNRMAEHYTPEDKAKFEMYLAGQLDKIVIPNKDEAFLKDCMLKMYANPAINKLRIKKRSTTKVN